MTYLLLLFLIIVANGSPILGHWVLKNRWTYPLDCGWTFFDGRPLLGPAKTFRGVLLAIFITMLFALLIGLSLETGFVISVAAMVGDSLASFTKRRLGMSSGSQALGLDQIPECLFPLLAVQQTYHLTLEGILTTVIAFVILELFLSRILFVFHLRKHPY